MTTTPMPYRPDHARRSNGGRRGFATISTAIMLGLVLGIGMALVGYVLSGRMASKKVTGTFTAVQVAEAGIQKAIFCLNATSGTNCGGTYGSGYAGETDVDIGSGTFSTTTAGSGSFRTVTSVGTSASGVSSTLVADLTTVPPDDEMDFSYALQSGEGGAHLENNASISGTLYSNGDVTCQSTQAGADGDIFVAKVGGMIDSCDIGFHAYADKILDSDVHGDAYYANDPADIAGTTVDGAKFPGTATSAPEPLPDIDLQFWRDSAEAGTIIYGDYYPADNSALGPAKIVGDLIMDNNVDVVINGPIWVVGDIMTGNNSSFTLDSSWGGNSTTILADYPTDTANKGRIVITNNTGITGSGQPTSHLLFASTYSSVSDTVPAISVANNAAGAVFYAVNGVLRLENNAGAKSLAGYRLFVDQLGLVTYVESELAGLNFSNSPGGKWRLLEGTWREAKN